VHYTQSLLSAPSIAVTITDLTIRKGGFMSKAGKGDLEVGQKAPDFAALNDKG
jgi:hypothetical protein